MLVDQNKGVKNLLESQAALLGVCKANRKKYLAEISKEDCRKKMI